MHMAVRPPTEVYVIVSQYLYFPPKNRDSTTRVLKEVLNEQAEQPM